MLTIYSKLNKFVHVLKLMIFSFIIDTSTAMTFSWNQTMF